ncbi:BQ5605_C002g01803 [Microbotryum silenes-dioicae]|uniref:BQ5605_C002g01803 protein n=1 Tax=Microbotryum silenes-dioicae TaxID=796604 RepID=A0A2X0LZX6_9BASI|nr:BQ5605_C002g01803 [Microbotryum silenes-dioicae]
MAPSYIDSKGNLHDEAPWHHQVLVFVQEAWLALWLFLSTLINVSPHSSRYPNVCWPKLWRAPAD